MTKSKSVIVWIIIGAVVVLGALAYYFFVMKHNTNFTEVPSYKQTDIEIVRRLTADLNRQSVSTNIVDITTDLEATDFSVLTEGLIQ